MLDNINDVKSVFRMWPRRFAGLSMLVACSDFQKHLISKISTFGVVSLWRKISLPSTFKIHDKCAANARFPFVRKKIRKVWSDVNFETSLVSVDFFD